ncbi:MAG TPA: hypothetical protein VKZ18_07480 [Polyangia bacterium]|nr:hypothetical protein [Polyangia bacterium]
MKSASLSFVLLGCFGLAAACSSSSGGPTGTGGHTATGGGSGGSATGGGSGGSATGGGSGGSATGGSVGTGGTSTGGSGAGGNAGTGGAATGSGGSGTGGSAGSSGGCAGLALCDNFDTQSSGASPDSSLWTMIGAKTCSTQGTPWPFAVDSTQSHSPPNSMKVQGGDSCGPLMLNTSAFSKLTGSDVYGRFYVRLSDTSMTFDHAFMMALGLTSGTLNTGSQDTYLQLASEGAGNATNVLMWQTSDGNILPDKNTTGGASSTYPKVNTWTCVEFHTSSSTGALETWVDGTAVSGLTFIPGTTTKTSGVNDQWKAPSPFQPTSIGFGWTVFSGENLTIWFDDIAVGSTRIGCN